MISDAGLRAEIQVKLELEQSPAACQMGPVGSASGTPTRPRPVLPRDRVGGRS
jgi:hypothetical protein